MRPSLLLAVLLGAALTGAACGGPDSGDRPDLVVLLVVDQLAPDLMDRYDEAFEGGLRRLVDGGHGYSNAVHDHAATFTSPGHASLSTGRIPARHGVVGNSWREWRDGAWTSVSSVADPETELVGGEGTGASPRNLLTDGLPDWILDRHPGARVVSLSGKSTAAVTLAARAPGHVYWFNTGSEGFVTSTHYRDALPAWVERVNREGVPAALGDGCWRSELPESVAALSRRDTVDYEADGVHTHFPHCATDGRWDGPAHFLSRSPGLDVATLALAREAVEALELGRGEAPDYLALALSATDRIGHDFGPYSREQLDNLVRLDRELGAFLDFLDDAVGRGRYLVVLSADHGVLPLPEHLQERGEPGRRLTGEPGRILEEASRELDPTGAEHRTGTAEEARARLAAAVEEAEWVERAMPLELLAGDAPADSFVTLYRNAFHPERMTSSLAQHGVQVRLTEGTLSRSSGTTHGQPYLHDRRVPVIVYGAGVRAGRSGSPARTTDVAPTVAGILGLPVPDGLDGRELRLPLPP